MEEKELSIAPRETDEKFFSFMKPIVNELVALLKKLNENAVIYFTMKSEVKALVFIEPASEGVGRNCYKFELKNENGKYLIDKMFYYFKSENIFHRMHWL